MIARWIDWCARNPFLVFSGTVLLVLSGIWSLRRIPLDALPEQAKRLVASVIIPLAQTGCRTKKR